MRKEFELTDGELQDLLALSKPVPAIALNCGEPPMSSGSEEVNVYSAEGNQYVHTYE